MLKLYAKKDDNLECLLSNKMPGNKNSYMDDTHKELKMPIGI